MPKTLIIHGHFYQPPRENPYLNIITEQDVHPYHDWNERITAECYQPNASSRILDGVGRITRVINNYEYLSFNFGPTLLDYLAEKFPDTVERIAAADRASLRRTGFGNAMAQVYNHIILPLARYEDMISQIRWGIANFERHFGRTPEGMWLSEAAINRDVVDALWQCGIKFTVLSPYQASAVIIDGKTASVSDGSINTSHAYRLRGHRGGEIAAFFYHPHLARGIAFEHTLRDAHGFAGKIDEEFKCHTMVNIATDGESYGHHEPFADMCIAKYFADIAPERGITVTNYAAFLAGNPPVNEVLLHDGKDGSGSSWSCSHGVERWRSNCGCSTGGSDGWDQEWRGVLREAMDILRSAHESIFTSMIPLSAEATRTLRDEYIAAVYDRSRFAPLHVKYAPKLALDVFTALLESYRYSLYAYTSCGWFFADISGIEPVQNMKYADIAFQLLSFATGNSAPVRDAYASFMAALSHAKSNVASHGDGKTCFERWVLPERYTADKIAFHHIAEQLSRGIDVKKLADGMLYGYSVNITKRDKGKLALIVHSPRGTMTHVTLSLRRAGHEISATAVTDSSTATYGISDIVYDDRKRLSRRMLMSETAKLLSAGRAAFDTSLAIISAAERHRVPPPREMMHLFSAFFALKLDTLAEKEPGFAMGRFAEIEKLLAIAAANGIALDTHTFAERVESGIRDHLSRIRERFSVDECNAVITEMQFVSRISLAISRYSLENDVYSIIERYRHDRTLSIAEQASLRVLGQWFNFNMDEIAK